MEGVEDDLRRHKKPNIVDGQYVEEGDSDGMIANEFSSDEEADPDSGNEDMEEFMEHEEEFEARQSISSRGRNTRTNMMPDQNRPTEQPERQTNVEHQPQDYQPQQDYEYGEGEGDQSSVYTEIVDEKVINIDDDDEEFNNIVGGQPTKEEGISNYLDNINQEDYVNHDEYENNNPEENSPAAMEDQMRDEHFRQEQLRLEQERFQQQMNNFVQEDDVQNGVTEQELQDRLAYQNQMMENSPIAENPIEEELTTSPQYYEAPRAINPRIRKKFEGYNVNDKSHLIWEQERLERKRIEKRMQKANIWAKPYSFRDIEWDLNKNPKRANYNPEKNLKRSSMWHFGHSSSVPMLTPSNGKAGSNGSKTSKVSRQKHDPREGSAKSNHQLSNIFHQSSYQNMLKGTKDVNSSSILSSYTSLIKNKGRAFMTPIDNRYENQSSVLQGRAKNFYSSQIF